MRVFALIVASMMLFSVCSFAEEIEPVLDSMPIEEGTGGEFTVIADTVIIQESGVDDEQVRAFSADGIAPLAGGYYIDCNTSQLGILRIYVPYNYIDGFLTTTTGGNLFNLSSSTVTCTAFNDNGVQYTVRMTSFSEPQYRLYDYTSSTYYDLDVTEITDSNVRILSDNPALKMDENLIYLLLIFLLGVVVLCQFMRR